MKKYIAVGLLLLVPQLAVAKVFMCLDPATGQASFTDKACETPGAREEIRVDPANLDSGARYAGKPKKKVWRSEADTRKTGLDYNAQRRGFYENSATASTD